MSYRHCCLAAFFFLCLFLVPVPAEAQIGKILKDFGIGDKEGLSQEKAAEGLKEALEVGTKNTVKETGRLDGYLLNEAIKILLPEKIMKTERALRFAGFGPQIDEFVVSMNRAAEKAAPLAQDIFWKAIKGMSFSDALQILKGNETAATDYFRRETGDELKSAFKPAVSQAMGEVGATRQYKELVANMSSIPFLNTQAVDLDEYVLDKALSGLFHVLGEEEKKIRTNPAARVTDLLKEVFKK